ncbi:hypothetical protein [Knoellia sp. Soil729]|uniref:hypothetical protein n=1 Tax=Knoellia sp. Soil729 TaxID=1736394 RepID=UPI0007023809|nr:hypothetical protein [Knoellia sp. Soil729]KRE41098.1 hypothetical protein ASG74_14655 [Knoellia sp. Soil729]
MSTPSLTGPGQPTGPQGAGEPRRPGPPSKHELALMIWVCVFPTLTLINLTFGGWLGMMPSILRTLVLATVAVPIVIYLLMPQLHKGRARLLAKRAQS